MVTRCSFQGKYTGGGCFHEFFTWQFFSWNQSCQQLKSPKPQHFHEFSPPKNRQFSREIKSWIFEPKMKISNSVLKGLSGNCFGQNKIQFDELFVMKNSKHLMTRYFHEFFQWITKIFLNVSFSWFLFKGTRKYIIHRMNNPF